MSESKHTPGPWEWWTHGGTAHLVSLDGAQVYVLTPTLMGPRDNEQTYAIVAAGVHSEEWGQRCLVPITPGHPDARLIAAAPDLLAACELWDKGFTEGEDFTPEQFLKWVNDNRRAARAAIAKAKGGA